MAGLRQVHSRVNHTRKTLLKCKYQRMIIHNKTTNETKKTLLFNKSFGLWKFSICSFDPVDPYHGLRLEFESIHYGYFFLHLSLNT